MRNYNLHTENLTVMKQHWHMYIMTYLGPLMTTKVYYLLCSILSAAFDTVDHDVLPERLKSGLDICGTALNWFKPYLSGRSQSVLSDGTQSKSTSLACGVPQRICTWSNSIQYLHIAFGWHNQEAWNAVSHVCRWLSIMYYFTTFEAFNINQLWVWKFWLMTSVVGTRIIC